MTPSVFFTKKPMIIRVLWAFSLFLTLNLSKMKKIILLLLVAITCMFVNCPVKDGEQILIECQAVDLSDNPLVKQKISLVSSDTILSLNSNLVVVEQAETDSKGKVSFWLNFNTKKYYFVIGDSTGRLKPIQTFGIPDVKFKDGTNFKMQFDDVTTIKIKMISNQAKLKSGSLHIEHGEEQGGSSLDKNITYTTFPINTPAFDTTLNVPMFSHAKFRIDGTIVTQDTSKRIDKIINRNGRRDTVFSLKF